MGAIATSLLVEQRVGIEAVTHYACRDRNLLGMLSDLLGAAALGLRNLLVITGDPPKMGPYPDATAVFDVDAIGLTNLVANLNRGLDPGGNAIGAPTRFVVGRGRQPGGRRPGARARALPLQGRGRGGVRDHAAGVRRRAARALRRRRRPRPGRGAAAGDRRHLAARERAQRRVPRQRGAGRDRARGGARPDAPGERASKEHAVAEGIAIAREMLEQGARPRAGGAGAARRSGARSWRSKCWMGWPASPLVPTPA
jgi:homocysteine S-methyltransferase